MKRVVLVGVALALVAAGPAQADTRLDYAKRWASQTFTPLCGDPVVAAGDAQGHWAYADPEGCAISLDVGWPRWPRWRLCALVTHEYGHLAGLPHSADQSDVMYVDPPVAAIPACLWVRAMEHREDRLRDRIETSRTARKAIRRKLAQVLAAIGP